MIAAASVVALGAALLVRSAREEEEEKELDPWVQRFPAPAPDTSALIRRRLQVRLRDGPPKSATDAGYLYAYRLEGDVPDMHKIGRTARTADKRLAEWRRQHKKKLIKVAQWRVSKACKWLERLVHLWLGSRRVARYDDGSDCWYATGEPLQPGGKKGLAMHKHVEWFLVPEEEMLELVDAFVKAYGGN